MSEEGKKGVNYFKKFREGEKDIRIKKEKIMMLVRDARGVSCMCVVVFAVARRWANMYSPLPRCS